MNIKKAYSVLDIILKVDDGFELYRFMKNGMREAHIFWGLQLIIIGFPGEKRYS